MYWAGKFGNVGLCFGAARRSCLSLVRAFGQGTASLGKAVSVWSGLVGLGAFRHGG